MYLTHFEFPDIEDEYDFILGQKLNCYDSYYPFLTLSKHRLSMLDFEPVTILYGSNGSGKSTALNVIAQTLNLRRDTLYNRSSFFETYTSMCSYQTAQDIPGESRIITSDDVFDFMLNLRSLNEGIDRRRDELLEDYMDTKYSHFQLKSLADYEQLRKVNLARSNTQSRYVRKNLKNNIREHSNGESALLYFQEKLQDNALYLLDEPENSLAPQKQLELLEFLENSVRFFGCQLIIATHSPFLLSMPYAKIYDLDEEPVDVKRWSELENIRVYYNFFKKHQTDFE